MRGRDSDEGEMTVVSCDDLRPRAGALIDGELAAGEALALEAHASTCHACAALVAEQRVTRAVVATRASELRGTAPEALRTSVERSLNAPAGAIVRPFPARTTSAPRRWASTVTSRWSVAAAVVLAVAGVFAVGGLGDSRLFAAQLALDHYKCALIDHGHEGVVATDLEAAWKSERGWDVVVPPTQPALGLSLVGIRRCLTAEGQVAHVLYEAGGRRVSLFIMPSAVDAGAADLSIMGVDTRSWSQDGRTYTLVGASGATAAQVADYMRAHAH